jgi:hypothetical protein
VRAPSNAEVAKRSEAVREKYKVLVYMEAQLDFAYELQGFVKAMVHDHNQDLDSVLAKIMELVVMLRDAQNNPQRVKRW